MGCQARPQEDGRCQEGCCRCRCWQEGSWKLQAARQGAQGQEARCQEGQEAQGCQEARCQEGCQAREGRQEARQEGCPQEEVNFFRPLPTPKQMAFFKANQILLKENILYPLLSKAYQYAADHIQHKMMSHCSVHNILLKMVSSMELEIGRDRLLTRSKRIMSQYSLDNFSLKTFSSMV